MRALIDVDGVVANFSEHLLGRVGSSATFDDVTEWDIFSLIERKDGPERKKVALQMMEDPEFWASLPVMEGAIEGVNIIKETMEVFWVTSPWPTCQGWDIARRTWLNTHFGADPKHVIITASKFVCVGDMFIDDHVDNVEKWQQHHPDKMALLYDAPYNKGEKHVRFSW